jgi:hypothetical protein
VVLQITDDTRIHVRGRRGAFSDLLEGDRITAFYESRAGINTATSIETKARRESGFTLGSRERR